MMRFQMYTDPGAAWIKVPLQVLQAADMCEVIAERSAPGEDGARMTPGFVYLDEEGGFSELKAAMERSGEPIEVVQIHHDPEWSIVRDFPQYNGEVAKLGWEGALLSAVSPVTGSDATYQVRAVDLQVEEPMFYAVAVGDGAAPGDVVRIPIARAASYASVIGHAPMPVPALDPDVDIAPVAAARGDDGPAPARQP